jgi:hypothetical protein
MPAKVLRYRLHGIKVACDFDAANGILDLSECDYRVAVSVSLLPILNDLLWNADSFFIVQLYGCVL